MLFSILLLCLCQSACALPGTGLKDAGDAIESSAGKVVHKSNVFGRDDRIHVRDNYDTVLRKIVRVVNNRSQGCTGSLVAPNLVLTNAHCIFDKDKQTKVRTFTKGTIFIYARYYKYRYADRARVTRVWHSKNYPGARANDWAILKLNKPLGKTFGWFGYSQNIDEIRNETISNAGFSNDVDKGHVLSYAKSCQVRSFQPHWGRILHDCDGARGNSGSPVWRCKNGNKDCRIYALQAAEFRGKGGKSLNLPQYSHDKANVAIYVSQFYDVLRSVRGKGYVSADVATPYTVRNVKQPVFRRYCTSVTSHNFKRNRNPVHYRYSYCSKKRSDCTKWKKYKLARSGNYAFRTVQHCHFSDTPVVMKTEFDELFRPGYQKKSYNLAMTYFSNLPRDKHPNSHCYANKKRYHFASRNKMMLFFGKHRDMRAGRCRYR